jgi:LytR cell envelope-related transcriptional attenuator
MHVIESIGPLLGIVAFAGLAFLAFLLFQQAREVRRLREWAGRAPERAQEAADAVQAAAEASRSEPDAEPVSAAAPGLRGRLRAAWARVRGATAPRLRAVDRRLPIDGRYLLAIAAVALVAAGVATSGFGLVGGNQDNGHHKHGSSAKPTVAVLNGTSVTGLADRIDKDVVKAAGYKTGLVSNTGSSFANTVVMYKPGHRAEAKALAAAVQPKLGKTLTQEMTSEVKARAGSATLALTLGLDDSQFGSG